MKRKFTPTKAIVIAVIALVSGVIVFFAAVTAALFIGVENAAEESATLQSKRLDELERVYADGTAPKISEADICAFDPSCAIADGVRINNLQYIATHNSYKRGLNGCTEFVYELFGWEEMVATGSIDNGSLTDQLNCGVRRFELDVSLRGESMTVCHNLLTESESYAPDVEGALRELKMWSDYNPQHLPVIVIMEFKNGISGQEGLTMEGILAFEELLYGVMGDKLFTPQDALGEYDSFAEFVAADAYPTSAETVGKFIFMLHATGNDADGQDDVFKRRRVGVSRHLPFGLKKRDRAFIGAVSFVMFCLWYGRSLE